MPQRLGGMGTRTTRTPERKEPHDMANRPDPNNPQIGDRFTYEGHVRTILARQGDWCWANCPSSKPWTVTVDYVAACWAPAPPTPPERWGIAWPDGSESAAVFDRATAEKWKRFNPGTVLVHYVGTVVEP